MIIKITTVTIVVTLSNSAIASDNTLEKMRGIANPYSELALEYELASDTCLHAVNLIGDDALKNDDCIKLNILASEFSASEVVETHDELLNLFGSLNTEQQTVAITDRAISDFLLGIINANNNVEEIELATSYRAPLTENALSFLAENNPSNVESINKNIAEWTEWVDKAKRLAIECDSSITYSDKVSDKNTCIRANSYYADPVLRDVMEELAEKADRLSPNAKKAMMNDESFRHFYSTYAEAEIYMQRYYQILGYTPK